MSTVIKVENLSKRYYLSHNQKERFPTLRDALINKVDEYGKRLLHPFKASSGQSLIDSAGTEEFWALKDVSFEVKQGDRVGIIGRNGAGKSTLLKILSRITEPTSGRVSIKGRVASLLEVGTGFHPELTGRENIFLNGAILGMGKQEIRRKFDEIVDFAEIEKFLDTPVKRYSSGMYVRLAFAVAAHLEPEILIVDEVLAVGDLQFQKKCLHKMRDVGKEGRTILLVSHNMDAIGSLCRKALYLDGGKVVTSGHVDDVLHKYISNSFHAFGMSKKYLDDLSKEFCILGAKIETEAKQNEGMITFSDGIEICIEYRIRNDLVGGNLAIQLVNNGRVVFTSFDIDSEYPLYENRTKGDYQAIGFIPGKYLKPGSYVVNISTGKISYGVIDKKDNALSFEVVEKDEKISILSYSQRRAGIVASPVVWLTRRLG